MFDMSYQFIENRTRKLVAGMSTTRFRHWKKSSRHVFCVTSLEEGIKKYIPSWKKKLEESVLCQKLEEGWKKIFLSKNSVTPKGLDSLMSYVKVPKVVIK